MTIPPPLSLLLALGAGVGLAALAGCGPDAAEPAETSVHADASDAAVGTTPPADIAAALAGSPNRETIDALAAVPSAGEIPYPVYPNGRKYRVGGENGLKIVVFQTDDPFDEVDSYYRSVSADAGTPRLAAMSDYVRYPSDAKDADPWATYRPGIVIHEFGDADARRAAGATASARTNIIMSY